MTKTQFLFYGALAGCLFGFVFGMATAVRAQVDIANTPVIETPSASSTATMLEEKKNKTQEETLYEIQRTNEILRRIEAKI